MNANVDERFNVLNRNVTYSKKPSHAARAAHARGEREFSKYDTSLIRPKRSKKPLYIGIGVAIVAILLIIFGLVNCMGSCDKNPNMAPDGQEVRVEIPEGSTTPTIASILYDAGIIENQKAFSDEVSKRGAAASLKSGSYLFIGGTPLSEVIDHLVAGPGQSDSAYYVIPEGFTIERTAKAVSEAYGGAITEADFLAAARDASRFANRFSFVSDAYDNSLEGFLFPKTYEVVLGYTADDVIEQMLTQYELEVQTLNYTYPHEQGLSDYQTLILASIIEREAASDNKAMVASVFYNRLAIDMALQSDATTAYVIGGDPTPDDLKKESPFNTYLNNGLPPGPICSPGIASLEAACNPETSEYYYFYFKDNGQGGLDYFFSKTYEEHQAAIAS